MGSASFQLPNTIFHMVSIIRYAFSSGMNSLHAMFLESYISQGDPVFHNSNNVIIVKKMCLSSPSFISLTCRWVNLSTLHCSEYSCHSCLLPLLKRITHYLTVLTYTIWFPQTFHKCQWMSMGAILWYTSGFVRSCFAKLLLSCYQYQNKKKKKKDGSFGRRLYQYCQHLPLILWDNIR